MKIDKFHIHEAMDRTNMIASIWQDFIVDHPAVMDNPKWLKDAKKIARLIGKLYQDIGQ